MEERVDGGEHTGEIQEHSPWSLATSYFAQVGNKNIPLTKEGESLTPAQIAARQKKLADNYDKAMEQRKDGGEHTGEV